MVYAIGSNEIAVNLAGISISKYKLMVYGISGFLCGIAGIINTSRTAAGSPSAWMGLELDAIAAVVIGGASLAGGRGTIINTFFGVLILGIISNIMNLLNIPSYPQQVIKGVIILIAVLFQSNGNRNK
jgi:ribose transport system permease protein